MPSNKTQRKQWRGSLSCFIILLYFLLSLIVDGYYFVILYTKSNKRRRLCYDINKTKLEIIMSCQAPIVKEAESKLFSFLVFLWETYSHQAQKTTPTYIELLVSTFRLSLLFIFWFYLRFGLKFRFWNGKTVERWRHTQTWLGRFRRSWRFPRVHVFGFVGKRL